MNSCPRCRCALAGACADQIRTLTLERDAARIELIDLRERLEPLEKISPNEYAEQKEKSDADGHVGA